MIEIKGKNLTLRTMTQKEMRALWRKFEPKKDTGVNYVYDEETVDRMYERSVAREDWNPSVGIFLKNDEIIGQLSFEQVVYSENRCELTLFLANESYCGKGYGTEAITLAKRHAKEKMGIKRIYADASVQDERLQRAFKKCGFLHSKTYKGGMRDGSDRMVFVAIL